MKRDTKKILVAAGITVGAAAIVSAIVFWPKTASAKTPGLPAELDANLTEQEKRDVTNLIYNNNDPAALTQAAYRYQQEGAPLAAGYLADKALSLIAPQLDQPVTVGARDILLPLYIWNDPVQIQSAALVLQNKGMPKAAKMVMDRAVALSKLG